MPRRTRLAVLIVSTLLAATSLTAQVVISQIYGGGGNSNATYRNDFVELFNSGTSAVDLAGWSIQYASTTGSSWTNKTALSGTIQPGHYFLVQEASGGTNGVLLPATDITTGTINMSASAGKVALVNNSTTLPAVACPTGSGIVDFVGFGSGTNCFEGTGPTATLSSILAAIRANAGCTDTNSNAADFAAATPTPRNSSTPANTCGGGPPVNNPPTITAPANPAASVVVGTASVNVNLSGNDDGGVYNWSVGGASHATVAISGSSTNANVTVAVTLEAGYVGTASFTATLSDTVNTPVSRTVNIEVTNVPGSTPGTVVISQIYGGGGNQDSTLANDFIELFNTGNTPVDLTGWSVQHFFTFPANTWMSTPLTGVIQPHSYYLVQEAAGTTPGGGTTPLPTPDATGDITVSATNGVVVLSTSSGLLSGTGCATRADVVDSVIYGSIGTTCTGRVILGPGLSNTNGAIRGLGGCRYAPAATDFSIAPPAPRNSHSPTNDCSTATETISPHVFISQLYGGGGNSGAVYSNDFVELYNPTDADVALDGWSIQYASAAGTDWSNSQVLGGTIAAHGYFLIELAAGTGGGPALPPPRIIGDINMSGSAGKLALVHSYTQLSGGCPIGDPSLVDFVGYGNTATCFEGGLAAAGLSNSKALLRATNSDTNQNSVDFSLATPNPRGSGDLVELPPLVASVDPKDKEPDAPYDASITVNFSEPVNVAPGWFSVTCTTTGVHTNFQVTSAFNGTAYILTPTTSNDTFAPREKCTVHLFKSLVTDQDTNDGPNGLNDNMPADVVWTFTVTTGTPVENADVHLTMGNPSGAIDSTATPDNYLMKKPEYSESYNASKSTPNWVSWHLTNEWTGTGGRSDTFRPDPALPPTWYRVLQTDFSGSGFDRGHMCPSADRTANVPINEATFLMSNMVPQGPNNNQGPWENFEAYLRSLTVCTLITDPCKELYIVSGPEGSMGTVANGHVTIPAATWKVVLVLPELDGNDVARVDASTTTLAIRIPNNLGADKKSSPWTDYETSVRDIESTTGYDFFSNVPKNIQNSIEANSTGDPSKNPPGVSDQSASTTEDNAVAIALKAVSPDSAATYTTTIVLAPKFGILSGSGLTQTYTPNADFNGTDSFDFTVNDGHATSNAARVTIQVSEINDPPLATADTLQTEAGNALSIPAATLLANDAAGPANENSQTLTLASVTAGTHGTVALANGQATFTPEQYFVGAASFTYSVCDNGTTAGQPDPKCSTGTVGVNVVDTAAPTISALSVDAKQLWPANHQMIDVNVAYTATDSGDPSPLCTLSVLSSEPVNGTGDGDTSPDWTIVDAHRVQLRAERAATGNGRTYTITATCSDRSQNVALSGGAAVVVPKSMGGK